MYLLFDASRLSGLSPAADYPRFYLLSVINVTLSVDIPHKSGSKPLRPPGPNSPFLFFLLLFLSVFLPPRFSLSIWSRIITRLLHSCCPSRQTSTRTLVKKKKQQRVWKSGKQIRNDTVHSCNTWLRNISAFVLVITSLVRRARRRGDSCEDQWRGVCWSQATICGLFEEMLGRSYTTPQSGNIDGEEVDGRLRSHRRHIVSGTVKRFWKGTFCSKDASSVGWDNFEKVFRNTWSTFVAVFLKTNAFVFRTEHRACYT